MHNYGDFDCRGSGALQKALISVTAHQCMQKPSILPYLAVKGECALRGRCALRNAPHSVKVYTRVCANLVKIPHNDHTSTQDETKTKNNGLLCMVLAILASGGAAAKKTLRAAALPESVHIFRFFPQLKESAGLAMTARDAKPPPHVNRNPTNPGSGGRGEVRFEPLCTRLYTRLCTETCQTRGEAFWPR